MTSSPAPCIQGLRLWWLNGNGPVTARTAVLVARRLGVVRLDVIPPERRNRGRPTAHHSANNVTAFGFGIRSSLLRWILSFVLPVAFLPLTLAEPCLDKWRIVTVMSVGASAMGSLATSVASLHLDIESVSKNTRPADVPLRIGATALPVCLPGCTRSAS